MLIDLVNLGIVQSDSPEWDGYRTTIRFSTGAFTREDFALDALTQWAR